jgi:hypothetical protein
MSDLAAAMADRSKLVPFEGADVLRVQVAVTGAGDGLSEAMAVDPHPLALGTTVHVVLECQVQQIKFVPAVDKAHPEEGLARVHVLRAGRATLVDAEDVALALDAQSERIRLAREQAAGIQRLAPAGGDPDYDDET